jgi:hypothetical protein
MAGRMAGVVVVVVVAAAAGEEEAKVNALRN